MLNGQKVKDDWENQQILHYANNLTALWTKPIKECSVGVYIL